MQAILRAAHVDDATFAVDVLHVKALQLADPQAGAIEKNEHRAVFYVARAREQLLDLFGREDVRLGTINPDLTER